MAINLYGYQKDAMNRMRNGCILCGSVGSGKSRTALAYYYTQQGGDISRPYHRIKNAQDLYIITTARKRDTLEWEKELVPFLLSTKIEECKLNCKVVVDSWNNISKYKEVKGAFFIFDEQRVVGSGVWVKSFLKIAKSNVWILLSATPGDTWSDYIPVFIANGYFKNRTEFLREHAVYSRFSRFPKIDHFVNTGKLNKYRRDILIDMDYKNSHVRHDIDRIADYDRDAYKRVNKFRINPDTNEPIENISELCYTLRKISNSDSSRGEIVKDIVKDCKKAIIFYSFDYELEYLKSLDYGKNVKKAEWNGHKHEPIPTNDNWVYFVQYFAGAEGWNCTTTDTIIFFSQNYSYKTMVQSCGRIDRLNSPYEHLYYYHIRSMSPIDIAISRALKEKKKFNEEKFVKW